MRIRIIERPPEIYRRLFPGAIFRLPKPEPTVYLTFDDGPIPEVTPWVLDVLHRYGIKATFFMVGDNARRHPELVERILQEGHALGNHTMHHLQGRKVDTDTYLSDIAEAAKYVKSTLFRPPHGILRPSQSKALRKDYQMVMYDLITRDYSRHLDAQRVFENVRDLTRNGSIIVFHDSLKSWPRLQEALPRSLDHLLSAGYTFALLPLPNPSKI